MRISATRWPPPKRGACKLGLCSKRHGRHVSSSQVGGNPSRDLGQVDIVVQVKVPRDRFEHAVSCFDRRVDAQVEQPIEAPWSE